MTVNDYWNVISRRHQTKVRILAERHSVSIDRAFRNIVNYLKQQETSQLLESEKSPCLLTGRLGNGNLRDCSV